MLPSSDVVFVAVPGNSPTDPSWLHSLFTLLPRIVVISAPCELVVTTHIPRFGRDVPLPHGLLPCSDSGLQKPELGVVGLIGDTGYWETWLEICKPYHPVRYLLWTQQRARCLIAHLVYLMLMTSFSRQGNSSMADT